MKKCPLPNVGRLDGSKAIKNGSVDGGAAHTCVMSRIEVQQWGEWAMAFQVGSTARGKAQQRQHRVLRDLEDFYDFSTGQWLLRHGFLCPNCSSNGVPERRDYRGLKLSGQSPGRAKVQRGPHKKEHTRRRRGAETDICMQMRLHAYICFICI